MDRLIYIMWKIIGYIVWTVAILAIVYSCSAKYINNKLTHSKFKIERYTGIKNL